MIKRLALLCCILLLPATAFSAGEGTTNYGDFWIGAQVGGVFTSNQNVNFALPNRFPGLRVTESLTTDAGFSAGAIIGYNFCMSYRQPWERFFGVALDFQWNQFNQSIGNSPTFNGNQFALSFLGRFQYPIWGSDRFTRGRIVPFLMFGPSIVWTSSDLYDFSRAIDTSTNFAFVAEVGVDFFVCPAVSVGPSFRYRHIWGVEFPGNFDYNPNQFMILGRVAYHF